MPRTAGLSSLTARLWRRSDPERRQAIARVIFVGGALAYAWSGYFAAHAPSEQDLALGQGTALAAACIAALILLSFRKWPGESRARRLLGISHDICVVTVALHLGGESTSFFSVVYLVIILASGVRFGVGYLAFAALGSMAGFGAAYASSPYWRGNVPLTLNVVLVLTLVPAYMYGLIRSRQESRARLEHQATHDSLTGLMNRAGFLQKLEETVTPGVRDQALIYFDLDHFKAVNDSAGHAAGDKLLVDVAHILSDCVRSDDTCGRLGGDEFCVLLQACPLPLAEEIARRIRARVQAYRLNWAGQQYAIGASIGIVSSRSVEDAPTFLRLADAACYAAKNAGRNQVHVVDTTSTRIDTGRLRQLHTRNRSPEST